jgi:hypothetical protein
MRTFLVGLVGASALLLAPSASPKDFGPGDLRVCNTQRCVAIVNRDVLPLVGSLYYSGPHPARVRRPALEAPYYELRFRNGYVTGIIATRRSTAFSATASTWIGSPATGGTQPPRRLAKELRRLTTGLRALRLTRAALARSH